MNSSNYALFYLRTDCYQHDSFVSAVKSCQTLNIYVRMFGNVRQWVFEYFKVETLTNIRKKSSMFGGSCQQFSTYETADILGIFSKSLRIFLIFFFFFHQNFTDFNVLQKATVMRSILYMSILEWLWKFHLQDDHFKLEYPA